jgi:hypothetical protein
MKEFLTNMLVTYTSLTAFNMVGSNSQFKCKVIIMLSIALKHNNSLRNLDYYNVVVGKVVLAPILDVLLSKLCSTETGPKGTTP